VKTETPLRIVRTQGDTHDDCLDIVEGWWKLWRLGGENGLLPRGAIAGGTMIMGPSVVVGKPVGEAHELESEQEGAGV